MSTEREAMQPRPQISGPRYQPESLEQEREIHDYIHRHRQSILTCPMCQWHKDELLRLHQLLPIRVPSQTEQLMAMMNTPEYKQAVERHLRDYDQKGEPMAQVDSDTLKAKIDLHENQQASVKAELAAVQQQLKTNQELLADLQATHTADIKSIQAQMTKLAQDHEAATAKIATALNDLSKPVPPAVEKPAPTKE